MNHITRQYEAKSLQSVGGGGVAQPKGKGYSSGWIGT